MRPRMKLRRLKPGKRRRPRATHGASSDATRPMFDLQVPPQLKHLLTTRWPQELGVTRRLSWVLAGFGSSPRRASRSIGGIFSRLAVWLHRCT